MTDRPILFSAPMVRALLDGRKTQTRRILNPQPPTVEQFRGADFGLDPAVADGVKLYSQNDYPRLPKHPTKWDLLGSVGVARDAGFPAQYDVRFAKGDRLWVRESHRISTWHEDGAVWLTYDADGACSRALEPPDEEFVERLCRKLDKAGVPAKDNGFYSDDIPEGLLRRVSIHMPRWASRLTLTVTDVRVERLQEISEEDARAEGLRKLSKDDGRLWKFGMADRDGLPGRDNDGWPWAHWSTDHRLAFAQLWDSINGEDAWAENPWVVALTFTVEKRNIDA